MEDRRRPWQLAALPGAALLTFDPASWYPFGPLRWALVSTLVLAGSAQVLGQRSPRLGRLVAWALAVLLLALAASALQGADPVYAWIGTPERTFGWLTWALCALALVAGSALDHERDGPLVAGGLVVAGLGVGAMAAVEACGARLGPVGAASSRLTSTLGSPAYLGAACALLLPICIGVGADQRARPVLRRVALVAAALLLVAVVGSGARAAWMGLLAAACSTAWCRRAHLRRRPRRVVVAALVGVVATVGLVTLTPVGERVHSTLDADAPGGRSRIDEWRVAARVAARHPVAGVGPEGYRIAFHEGVDAAYERAHGRRPLPDRAHSGPLDVLLAGGTLALCAWLVVLGAALVGCRRALKDGPPSLAGVGAGLVAHWVGQVLLFPLAELEPLAWLLAGLVLASRQPAGSPVTQARWTRSRAVLVGSLGALAVAAVVAGGLAITADRRAEAASDALARGDAHAALALADEAARLRPDVIRYRLLAARAAVAADRGTLAGLARVQRALDVSPGDPIALEERVRLLLARARATQVPSHVREARRAADALVARDRVDARLRLLAGEAAVLDGDERGAERAWRRAEDLAPRDATAPLDLALLYHQQGRSEAAARALQRARAADPQDPAVARVAAQLADR